MREMTQLEMKNTKIFIFLTSQCKLPFQTNYVTNLEYSIDEPEKCSCLKHKRKQNTWVNVKWTQWIQNAWNTWNPTVHYKRCFSIQIGNKISFLKNTAGSMIYYWRYLFDKWKPKMFTDFCNQGVFWYCFMLHRSKTETKYIKFGYTNILMGSFHQGNYTVIIIF